MTCYTYKASVSGTQDVIEYETLTSGQSVPFERRERLHEWLKAEDIEQLHQAFLDHPEQMLNFNELRAALLKLDISFTDPEFNRLFLKINQNRDFKCDWDEFISYLIFGFQEDDPSTQKEALILPISTPPIVKKSEHRSAIVGITLMRGQEAAKVTAEDDQKTGLDETQNTIGMWVTASKEGQIKFWTPQLEPIRGGYSESTSVSGTQDIIEYETLTSGQSVPFERRERLHEWLKAEDIEQLPQAFLDHPEQMLNFNELRAALLKLDISFTDPEFNRLFLKINQNRDFKCDWDEFISYLIFGFQEDDPSTQKEALILPISTPPIVKKSEHRSAIVGITLMRGQEAAKVTAEDDQKTGLDETQNTIGMWVTASKEGQIKFWTPQLEPIRGGYSESIYLKMTTWILAVQAMSDVGIICTASTERELRFHETIASTFSLRLVIRSVPFAVCCMAYNSDPKSNSRLVLGDLGGNVRILEFSPHQRGPFQSKPGAALIELVWTDILKGKLPLFIPHEHLNIHSELICKVFYSIRTSNLVTASEYRNTKKYRGRCPGLIIVGTTESTVFRIPLGVTTFFFDDKQNIVVTGGPDTFVRIWDIFIPVKPSGILTGHNGGIVMVFLQFEDKKVFSVDYQKILKVWHLDEHTLLQTFGDLVFLMPNELDIVYNYNTKGRDLLVGGRKFINIKCNPKVRTDLTDGNTHAGPVSVLLYNSLFRNLVTCGLDSYIIVWDPWSGKRKIIMKSCHTKQIYGETIDIEITAACFDPLEQFLLTGARDGSLKIWNYNNAVCMRNMSIKSEHEVTAVIWVVERILAVGWDQQVTEFNDAQGREYGDPKKWPKFHGDDITCADVKMGEGVVTATYSGELIFWKLETGQPYRRYNVAEPRKFIELKYNVDEQDKLRKSHEEVHQINISRFVRRSVSENIRSIEDQLRFSTSSKLKALNAQSDEREAILLESIRRQQTALPLSVQAVLFLQKRPMTREHGSVFVALDTGIMQVYSHHQRGGYIDQFNSIHKTGDCVLTMTTDRKNRFLFTGTAFGYIKIWLIENYCVPQSEKVHVCMPLLRLQFIFLRKERFLTRAKRLVRNLKEPLLVNSYKAHLQAINSIVFINLPKVLLSGSHDCSCRLWSIGGRYLGTLGTILPWKNLSPFDQPDDTLVYRLPPEIQKVASSTTMKVISGVQIDRVKIKPMTKTEDPNNNDVEEEATNIYGKPLREPILGKHFTLPGKSAQEQRIELNQSYSYIPVYTQLKVHETPQIERPPTPPIIHETLKEEYMDFYMPVETKIKDINTTKSGHQLVTEADHNPISDK